VEFEVLQTLRINAAAAHGDNSSLLEHVLQNSPAIRDLDLSFPTCDLEGCRLQGITWRYSFPSLTTLSLRTYNSSNTSLADFLLRHLKIKTMAWDVEADDAFIFPANSLPELQALSINFHGNKNLVKAVFDRLTACRDLIHLKMDGCPHASYLQVATLSKTLKCLELDPGVAYWREGFAEPDEEDEEATSTLEKETGMRNLSEIIRNIIGKMGGLRELAVDLETGNTFFCEDGEWVNPDPLNLGDLVCLSSLSNHMTGVAC
jgi:hypothetical protein